jgi:hypothetical protein
MINTREIASEYRLQHWVGILQEQKASGQSVKAYCQANGFHQNRFFYWQRKLREAVCNELLPAVRSEQNAAFAPNGWTAVAEAEPPDVPSLPIELGKFKVTVSASMDAELLARTLKVLAELC